MKKLNILITGLIFSIGLFSQSWKYHDINTFGQNVVYDYVVDANQKVWMNTSGGFCIYDLQTDQYDTCIIGSNGSLINNNNRIVEANNLYWIVTSNGISSYDGNTFTHYSTSNGLLNNTIEDLTVDTSGQLWLAHLNGVSHFNGSQFVHDSGIVARQIAVDGSNRIFVLGRNTILIGGPAVFGQVQVKVGNTWTTQNITGIAPFSSGGAVINLTAMYVTGGKVIITTPQYDGGYYTLTYPAQIDSVKTTWEDKPSANPFTIKEVKIDRNGKKWVVSDVGDSKVFSGTTYQVKQHYVDPMAFSGNQTYFDRSFKKIVVQGNSIIGYTDAGFFSSTIDIEPPERVEEAIEINSIRTNASVIGPLFYNQKDFNAGFEMPKGSNSYGIYAANVMLSAKKSGDTIFRMNQLGSFSNNFSIGPVNNSSGLSGTWITKVSQQDIQDHVSNYMNSGYVVPENIQDWKGNGDVNLGMAAQLANFVDVNRNAVYEPHLGDYPIIKGDEAIYWINHTGDLEYHGMLYGYDQPNDSALNQSLFLQYEIFNRANVAYDSIKLGLFADFDLGNSADDYMGCDSLKNTFFVYNGDAFDESVRGLNGFGSDIPFVGVRFLSDSLDGYTQYNIGSGSNGDPNISEHWHNYLNGKWKSGNPITFGGDGYQTSSSVPTKYMYTGAMWSEDNPGFGLNRNAPGDRRGLGHIPYFSLQPGKSKTVEVVIGYALKANGGRLGSKDKLINYLDSAKKHWERSVVTGIDQVDDLQSKTGFTLYPNPTNSQVIIELSRNRQTVERLQIFSLDGRLIQEELLTQQRTKLELDGLKKGIYFIRVGHQTHKLIKQ